MGLPIWKLKDDNLQQQQHKLQSPPKPQHASSASPRPLHAHYRLYRRQQRSTTTTTTNSRPTITSSYYLSPDHHHLPHQHMLHPLTTEQLQHDHHFQPLRSHAAEERHINNNNDNQQLERRLNEKQELLDQLNITISLLDQFLSMRDLSGQENVALPPFITDDLLAILTATSATFNSTSIPSNTGPAHDSPSHQRSLSRSTSIDTASHTTTSRLADLESSIVSAHHRVSDRLNLLGAILPVPSTTTR